MTDRQPVPPELAAFYRRAAALYSHWRRKEPGADGESAIFEEMKSDEDWYALVCALMNLTNGLVKAARDGQEDEYLAYVLRESMLDEVTGD